jgi:hypothetical protein
MEWCQGPNQQDIIVRAGASFKYRDRGASRLIMSVGRRNFQGIQKTSDIAMLQKLSDEVRECYQHAKDCARSAATQTDPAVQQSFLDARQSWLKLVRRLAAERERN